MSQNEKLVGLLTHHMRKPFAVGVANEIISNGFVDLSHIMLLETDEDYGPFQMPKVVLYNENHVTQEEALRIVKAGEYNSSVLVLPKCQWDTLFLNRKEV